MSGLVCSLCGGGSVAVNKARPSIDDRYALGYCEGCCPVPPIDPDAPGRTKPRNRRTVELVRSDLWDPGILSASREQARIRRLFNGKRLDDKDDAERAALRQRWTAEAEARRSDR